MRSLSQAKEWDKNNRAILELAKRVREDPTRLLRGFGFDPVQHHAVALGANGIIEIGADVSALEMKLRASSDGMVVMCINLDAKPRPESPSAKKKHPLHSSAGKGVPKKAKRSVDDILLEEDADGDFDF